MVCRLCLGAAGSWGFPPGPPSALGDLLNRYSLAFRWLRTPVRDLAFVPGAFPISDCAMAWCGGGNQRRHMTRWEIEISLLSCLF